MVGNKRGKFTERACARGRNARKEVGGVGRKSRGWGPSTQVKKGGGKKALGGNLLHKETSRKNKLWGLG